MSTATEPTETPEIDSYDLYKRQLGFYNPTERLNDTVNIIGLGGIGSFAAFGIAKLGVPHVHLMDDDTVELHNIPNQLHSLSDPGVPKVHSMANTIAHYCGITAHAHNGRITADGFTGTEWNPTGIVISGVDSMSSRMDIWHYGSIKYNPRIDLYIDARIAGQFIVIYALNPNDHAATKRYEATLHDDADAVPAACTERGVIDVGLTVGALLTNMVRHALTGTSIPPITTTDLAGPPVTSGDWIL